MKKLLLSLIAGLIYISIPLFSFSDDITPSVLTRCAEGSESGLCPVYVNFQTVRGWFKKTEFEDVGNNIWGVCSSTEYTQLQGVQVFAIRPASYTSPYWDWWRWDDLACNRDHGDVTTQSFYSYNYKGYWIPVVMATELAAYYYFYMQNDYLIMNYYTGSEKCAIWLSTECD